jgi:hypothetical protein
LIETESGSEPGSPRPESIPPERLEHQLELIVTSRVGENQVTWTIFGIFWAAQVLLVGVLFQGAFPPHPVAGIVVSILGIVMSTAWALTQSRSLSHLERFEDLSKSIEEQLQEAGRLSKEHHLTISPRFPGLRARTVMRLCCWGAVVAWFGSAVTFIACECRCGVRWS